MPEYTQATELSSEEEAKARLAAIVESSDDAIIGKALDGTITSWNRGAEMVYGYLAREAIGQHISLLVPADRAEELQQITQRIDRGERVKHLETVRLAKDGRRIDVSLTISPIIGVGGAITGSSTIARDISERRHLERLLRESERRYRTQVEHAIDAVIVHQDGQFVYANCAALGLYGAKALSELQGWTVVDLIEPDDRDAVLTRLQQLLEGEEIPLREYRLLRLDGSSVPVEASSVLIDYQGKPSIQVIARDVSERKRAESEREGLLQALEYERARFETVVRQMPIGVLIAEAPSGRLIYSNEASRRILPGDMLALESVADYGNWRVRRLDGTRLTPEENPLIRALIKGETIINEELQLDRRDGTRGFVSVNAAPINDSAGRIVSSVAAFSDITDRKSATEALRQSEERLKLALDATGMGSCAMNAATGEGIWSQQHFLLLGYDPPPDGSGSASIGMWQSRIHPDDLPQVLQALEQARGAHTLCRTEHRLIRAHDAQVIWVNVLGRFIYDYAGAAVTFIGVIFDVSERRASEEKIRESELRHRLLFETSPQGIVYLNADGKIVMANPAAQEILGKSPEELLGKNTRELDLKMEREGGEPFPVTERPCSLALQGEACRDVVLRIYNARSASHRWLSVSAVPLFLAGAERPYQVYATFEDITPRRRTEEALRASEAKFRRLFESNLMAIFFWNKNGNIVEANQAYCDLVGVPVEQCRDGKLNWLDATPPELFRRDFAAIEEIMSQGVCKPYEKEFINRQQGRRVPVLSAGARMAGVDGEGMGFAIDLTELKRAEEAKKESEATLKLAVETTGLGTFDYDLRSGEMTWSDIAKRHFGLSPEAELDRGTFFSGVHPEDRERVEQLGRDAFRPEGGGDFRAQFRTIGIKDGKERWLSVRGQALFGDDGEPLRLVGACLDVTDTVLAENALKEEVAERLRAVEELHLQEQLLIRQGRLAALGEMIGNIAHQWRQPLNSLALIVQELPWYYQRGLFNKDYLDASVTRAMQLINHMSKTIDGFRNFFEPDKEKVSFRVSEVLAKTLSIVEAAFNELSLKIEVHADADLFLYGCPNEFSQVILNILVNAKDAILERKVDSPRVVIRLFGENGKTVLSITDNAGGIPAQIMDRIFDPYFTTKGPDQGTGIGLFMSKTIIEKNMGGTLSVRNTEDGAEFRIEV